MNENNNQNNIKLQYVNPLNPNEILKESTVNKEESVSNVKVNTEPNMNNEIKTNNEKINENNSSDNTNTRKTVVFKNNKKLKLIVIIAILLIFVVILVSIIIFPKLNKPTTPDIPSGNDTNINKTITLNDIISNVNDNIYYKLLSNNYTVTVTSSDNLILFNLSNEFTNKQITFNLDGRNLTTTINKLEDYQDNLYALYIVLDGIGIFNGHGINETSNYLSAVQNNLQFNTIGITTFDNPDTYDITINIDTNFDVSQIKSLYINSNELSTVDLNNLYFKKGDIILYSTPNDITYNFIVGERNNLSNATYNTITSIIEKLYPEEVNDFKTKFTTLSTISFDKYKITLDPVFDGLTEYKNNYKFILIEITK